MKISVLLNNKYYKRTEILEIIDQIPVLKKAVKQIISIGKSNDVAQFLIAAKDLQNKKYDKVIIFDGDGFLPYMLLAKQDKIVPAYPLHKQIASLTVQHNNANVLIIPKLFINPKEIKTYLTNHLNATFEGGRHDTRVKLMTNSWSKTDKPIKFNPKSKSIIICSDHAGFKLKQEVILYLFKKGYNIVDVGCDAPDSTHYPMWAMNLAFHADMAYTGIAICSSGVGISVTLNKFKGLRACICHKPVAAKIAKTQYNANIVALGANFVKKADAIKVIDTFLSTKAKETPESKIVDKYGFKFDKSKFKKVKFNRAILMPDLLE